MRLDAEQLADLNVRIAQEVFNANMDSSLFMLLRRMGMDYLLDEVNGVDTGNPMGDILVIGALAAPQDKLLGIAKDMGYRKQRFRFLDYEEAKSYDYRNLQYSRSVCLVLVGPTPHKTMGTGDSRSLVSELENHPDMYPRTERLSASNGDLKVSKNNFRAALAGLTRSGAICPDICDAATMEAIR